MSKAKLSLLLGGTLASGIAMAAPPQFGEWSADKTGGVTDIEACAGRTNIISCQVLVEDNGFIQVQVKDTDGFSYIQSIIADGLTDGTVGAGAADTPFWDENYIRINFQAQLSTLPSFTAGDPGFMGKQAILDSHITSGNTWFEATTTIATGWGLDLLYPGAQAQGATVAVDLTTDFWTTDGTIDPATGKGTYNGMFDTRFYYQAYNDASGAIIGRIIDIDQDLSLQTINPMGGPGTNLNDRQYFLYMDRSGVLLDNLGSGVWGSSTDSVAAIDDPFEGPNVGNDGAIEWGDGAPVSTDPSVQGEQVIAFYIGQEVTTAGFGQDGKSTFYHLQVDDTGAYDGIYEYSQAGSGFEDPSIFVDIGGTQYVDLGGYSEFWNGTEAAVFTPKWGRRTLDVMPDATGVAPNPNNAVWTP